MPEEISFQSGGYTLKGHLYLPSGGGPHPTVVMAGGWCYVKELVQPEYAKVFAEAGVAALVFDYRNFGDSEGDIRQHIDPWEQIEDYRNAISFAETLDVVDNSRIGLWGISYSGGHVLVVSAIDPRVRCAISNIPVVDGLLTMKQVHSALAYRELQDVLLEDRRKRQGANEYGYMPMSTENPAQELSTWPFPEVTSAFLHFQRTVAPNHEHRNTIASTELLMNYDVMPFARTRPERTDPDVGGGARRHHVVGEGDRGLQPDFDAAQGALRLRGDLPHDALQRHVATRDAGRAGSTIPRRAADYPVSLERRPSPCRAHGDGMEKAYGEFQSVVPADPPTSRSSSPARESDRGGASRADLERGDRRWCDLAPARAADRSIPGQSAVDSGGPPDPRGRRADHRPTREVRRLDRPCTDEREGRLDDRLRPPGQRRGARGRGSRHPIPRAHLL